MVTNRSVYGRAESVCDFSHARIHGATVVSISCTGKHVYNCPTSPSCRKRFVCSPKLGRLKLDNVGLRLIGRCTCASCARGASIFLILLSCLSVFYQLLHCLHAARTPCVSAIYSIYVNSTFVKMQEPQSF